MVQHGKTLRWWNNSRIKKLSAKIKESIKNWNGNPFYFRHELKEVRTYIHRQFRHLNKQNLKKDRDYEKEPKTNGWETH